MVSSRKTNPRKRVARKVAPGAGKPFRICGRCVNGYVIDYLDDGRREARRCWCWKQWLAEVKAAPVVSRKDLAAGS